jgi:hypothetical protein
MLAKLKQHYHSLDLSGRIDQVKNEYNDIKIKTYLVTLNLNLPVVYLYLTKTNGINRCYYESPVGGDRYTMTDNHRFDDELFDKEVLFSGYLFENTYIVENVLLYRKDFIEKEPLYDRLSLINELLDHFYVPDPVIETHKIMCKDYVEYEYLLSFLKEYANNLPYAKHINGLRFCPVEPGRDILIDDMSRLIPSQNSPIAPGSYIDRHKIVPNPKIDTCVFNVRTSNKPDVYELYMNDKYGNLRYYDIACIPNNVVSQKVRSIVSGTRKRFLCVFNREFGRWTPDSHTNAPINCITDLK